MSAIYKTLTNSKKQDSESSQGPKYKNRQRVLLLTSRGVTQRHRHLVSDIFAMMPHARKEPKFDKKSDPRLLKEVAEMYNCNNVLYFEARKYQDLYMWLAKAPNGPTIKFHIMNLHTMDEMNFIGNCLKGSRPVLSFGKEFESAPQYLLMKEMFTHIFGVPPRARKSKPFLDHVLSFSIVDNKVWVRNYQISLEGETNREENAELKLVEIGPRFVLTPILILEGAFCGAKIYENKEYISPNVARAQLKASVAAQARSRHEAQAAREVRVRENVLAEDPLSNKALFKNNEE
ncbi:ribosome biogenesis protein [Starmerella bacillaris]|uniref:Ribosome biogenesis protein n=1 Tax=Starmerella bacillaris TaxID=1247836 RepID=A0AAV5RJK1_STABA|nr:ribosome biogenesis protein [Starmerella bacillaris]